MDATHKMNERFVKAWASSPQKLPRRAHQRNRPITSSEVWSPEFRLTESNMQHIFKARRVVQKRITRLRGNVSTDHTALGHLALVLRTIFPTIKEETLRLIASNDFRNESITEFVEKYGEGQGFSSQMSWTKNS